MKQTSSSAVRTRAAVKRPPTALMQNDGAHANPNGSATESPHAVRIHEVAYALYEARGCVDGHDLEDWLAAEAAVAREAGGPRPKAGDH